MEEYLKQIKKQDLLSRKEEKELWLLYKEESDMNARQHLIQSYQPLVFKMVKQFTDNSQLMMDLIQEGNLGLIDAVDSFKIELEVNFSTFAQYHIRGRILNFLKNGIQVEPLINYKLAEDTLDEKVEKNHLIDKVQNTILDLPVKEQKVINELYFANKNAKTIAAEMNISLSYLYRLQKKAVKRIRGKLSCFIKHWNSNM
ncbi:MAG: sigma-70 family RNA polymerase sigma factor [Halothermotrichaceae bacterium]